MNRGIVRTANGLQTEMRSGDIGTYNPGVPLVVATDAAQVISAAQLQQGGGVVFLDALSAGRVLTTDTAVALIAAFFENGDIGDSVCVFVGIQDAFAGTWGAGTDVTLKGRATTPASSWSMIIITKTAATTVDWFVM